MTECRKTETKAANHEKELLQGADPAAIQLVIFFMEGKFLKKLWCCIGGGI